VIIFNLVSILHIENRRKEERKRAPCFGPWTLIFSRWRSNLAKIDFLSLPHFGRVGNQQSRTTKKKFQTLISPSAETSSQILKFNDSLACFSIIVVFNNQKVTIQIAFCLIESDFNLNIFFLRFSVIFWRGKQFHKIELKSFSFLVVS
jgi:hypothetical protein